MKESLRLAMLISGGGSTMQTIGRACQEGGALCGLVEPVVVISSREEAAGIQKAKDLGIPVEVVQRRDFPKGPEGLRHFGLKLRDVLYQYRPDAVTQNGWLALTPEEVVSAYEGQIFNQHPGPLNPDHLGSDGQPLHFGGKGMHGLAVHAAVLEFQSLAGRRFPTEATIHRVTPIYDQGAVVYRREVAVEDGDTPERLAARVLPVEHQIHIVFLRELYYGGVTELHRSASLILPIEETILFQAKEKARELYPNG